MEQYDEYDFRLRVLAQSPYSFVDVDDFFKDIEQGKVPYGFTRSMVQNASIWQLTVPVEESKDGTFQEHWCICCVRDVKYLDFSYSQIEKDMLQEGLLRIKREEFFRKHIPSHCGLYLDHLYLPSDVYHSVKEKRIFKYDCDGGSNDFNPYKGESN